MVRSKIQATQLVKRLTSHALGEVDMTSTQVRAAEILLNKSIASLSSITVEATVDSRRSADDFTDNDLAAIIAGASSTTAEGETDSAGELH